MSPSFRASALLCAALIGLPSITRADEPPPRELNVLLGGGHSMENWHGSSAFASIHFEMLSYSPRIAKHVTNGELVTSVTYSAVRQPRSWFGHKYGDPDDNVRAESLYIAARKNWRTNSAASFFAEFGSGPMWSNRRIPAATSRLNFDTQLGFGMRLRTRAAPLYCIYRFSHISNGGLSKRNPGLEVHSLAFGARVMLLR